MNCHFIRVRKSVCAGLLLCSYDWVCNVQRSSLCVPQFRRRACVCFSLFLCLFVFIWVWITGTQKLQKRAHWHKFIKLPRLGAIIWDTISEKLVSQDAKWVAGSLLWSPTYSNKGSLVLCGPRRGLCLFIHLSLTIIDKK